jgi:hypothetical protein
MSAFPSLPGSTRQSISSKKCSCEDGWMPGSSPGMTIVFVSTSQTANTASQTQPHDLATSSARVIPQTFRPSKEEGAGKTGCTLHPRSRAQRHTRKRARAYRFSGGNPAFPAQWFYDLFRALPGDRLSCHRRLRIAASLTPASGCQDHTTSPYATARSSRTLPRPPQPGPTFMTTAKRPSCGPGWRKLLALICPTSTEEYFS